MKLVIVESPSKAKTIQKYLGSEYKVVASGGHVCDLPKRSLGIDVNNKFKPEYTFTDQKKKELLSQFKDLANKATDIYIATDPDREGEAIGWHIASYLDILDKEKRITFDEISNKAVSRSLQIPKKINMNLVDAQQARRVIDRLVGYNVSPILSRKIKSGLSGGRVQSAVLKMIVDKENEIKKFIPQEYWLMFAYLLDEQKTSIKVSYHGTPLKKVRINNKIEAEKIEKESVGSTWEVLEVKKSKVSQKPYAPFSTSTMQQDASIKLGMSPSTSMRIAQQLYEGFDIAEHGHIALVTYIRTDSVRVSPEFQSETLNYIKRRFGDDYVPSRPNFYKNKGGTQDAHEAIRPIALDITPESIKEKVTNQQYRLYKLIYDRYLASQMSPAKINMLNADILAQNGDVKNLFKLSGKEVCFDGYMAVYTVAKEGNEEENDVSNLPSLTKGDKFTLDKIEKEQKFTQPPARYTEASLIKSMEENKIGRPSTYATVISVLSKRRYVEKEKRSVKPTQLGEMVNQFMVEHFTDIVDINFTATIEKSLDEIENGLAWHEVLESFYPKFNNDVEEARQTEKIHIEEEVSDVVCEKCGTNMVVKEGRYGRFLACPNYPKCKNVKSILEPVGVCPKCGGSILQKRTKAGKIFFGCNNYPKCDFATWSKPAPILCPKCASPMTVFENDNKEVYVCTKGTCKHRVLPNDK